MYRNASNKRPLDPFNLQKWALIQIQQKMLNKQHCFSFSFLIFLF